MFKTMMMADYGPIDEHFPSFEERVRATQRAGRPGSPCHSAHGVLYRASLIQTQAKRAKKVRFYRNGDLFFKGLVYAVSSERYRTFESLLADLTNSPLGDKNVMPNGVRYVFTLDGGKVTSLDEMKDEGCYVCASTHFFKKCNYPRSKDPNWNVNHPTAKHGGLRNDKFSYAYNDIEENREFIYPKLITVIRNGARPRKAVKILLNRKTAHSFQQVMSDISDAVKTTGGIVKKIYTMEGKKVTRLQDFFNDETNFLAYGAEKYSLDDFDLDDNEIRYVSSQKSVRSVKDRIKLRSPKPPRRLSAASNRSNEESPVDLKNVRRPHTVNIQSRVCPISPRAPRRVLSTKQPANSKFMNGNGLVNGHKGTNGSPELHSPPIELTTKYKTGNVIGEGNFAVVKECTNRSQQRAFALKIINKSKCRGKEQMIENEVSILRRVKHINIISLIEEFETNDELYLVMELVRGGDLFDAISSATKYTERDASGMLYNLISAINYLHTINVVHRDIKPENLLVCVHQDGSRSLKLGDFGLAMEVTEPLFIVCGTPTYVAPEVVAEAGYGLKIDVWAAGVITYILLCGFPPFVSATGNQNELFDKIMAGNYEFISPFWDEVSSSAKELISRMLCVDPEDRYSASEVLEHPWVADDCAKDEDLHSIIASKLDKNFTCSRKAKFPDQEAAVSLMTSTALDKASRYFQGRKQIPLQEYSTSTVDDDEEEVF